MTDLRDPEDTPDFGPEQQLYRTPKVATILGLSVETVRDWIKAGKLEAKQYNGYWYVPREEVLRVVNERHG